MEIDFAENEKRLKPVQALIGELRKGKELLFGLDDAAYVETSKATGSVGGHIRHNLNFVDSVLAGIETGIINYTKRVRDPLVETNRLYAAAKFDEAIAKLEKLTSHALTVEVLIASEIDAGLLHRSTISREIEFVHSHTVHHHALIAEKLDGVGIETRNKYLGVAPSTLEYWKSIAA